MSKAIYSQKSVKNNLFEKKIMEIYCLLQLVWYTLYQSVIIMMVISFFSGPLFLGFWRGIWQLWDIILEPMDFRLSIWYQSLWQNWNV